MQTLAYVPTENEFQRKAVLEADTSVRTSCGCRRQKKKSILQYSHRMAAAEWLVGFEKQRAMQECNARKYAIRQFSDL